MIIIGAGLSGLLAGYIFPTADIWERDEQAELNRHRHSALLRFRTDAISRVTGIEFRKVFVRKGIYYQDRFWEPSIQLANYYSLKVIGRILNRSIWDLEPVYRYIAPGDLQEQMLQAVGNRIAYKHPFVMDDLQPPAVRGPFVSTMPMPLLAREIFPAHAFINKVRFKYQDIQVWRFQIEDANVHQTIYFPGNETGIYRASITGDTFIAERVLRGGDLDDPQDIIAHEIPYVLRAFGIRPVGHFENTIHATQQRFGKIAPIDDVVRKAFIYQATKEFNIYSAGRFAIWKNVLMDEVLDDLLSIKRMITTGDAYTAHKEAHK